MADVISSSYKNRLAGGATAIDLDTDDIKVMLLSAAYTPSAAHDFRDDLTANEVAASGTYATGGSSLAGKAINVSGANYAFDSTDPAWTGATIAARYCALYKNVGTAATDPRVTFSARASAFTAFCPPVPYRLRFAGSFEIGSPPCTIPYFTTRWNVVPSSRSRRCSVR